ncbi:zinc finger protein 185 [Tiliqua scincoides]|uniref:zinc finger protein 185 n=1 Tax=Tiliqua scincoides TaxID=71010 RepID=UPI003461924F
MLSLGAVKDGVILPSEEDRKRIITQMKVRTTLKGDNSWIQQRSGGEEEQQRSPLGVFTKTVDKTGPSTTASNGSPKSAKTASLTRTSPGYKMSTEEYKKLAPYNVKREPTDPHEAERIVCPDEHKKRAEAASSVLRRTASKERSYVFSAAKKSSGSPSQDTPSFLAKRVDIEDDIGPRSRSQTVPASGWFSSRGKSIDTGSRSQAPKTSSESDSTFNHFSSLESSYRRPGDQEKNELLSRHDYAPKTSTSPSKSSENGEKVHSVPGTEKRGVIFSEDSYKAKPKSVTESQMSQAPRIVISPEASPKSRSSGHYRISDADTGVETHHWPKDGEYMSDRGADISRDSMKAISGERFNVPIHLRDDEVVGPSRSYSGFERKSTQEVGYESPSDTEYKKVEAHLAKFGSWSSESSFSTTGAQSEFLKAARRDEPELDTARSSSLSTESGVATPESQQGEYGDDSDTARSYYPFRDNYTTASPRSHRVPFYKDSCEPEVGSKGLLFVKESVNSTEFSSSPRYNSDNVASPSSSPSRSMVDPPDLERSTYSSATSLNSIPPKRSLEDICTYCGREIRNCAKITIENLKICCHEYCFRCGICHKPMGDLLDKIFIHRDIVHCDKCYEKLF